MKKSKKDKVKINSMDVAGLREMVLGLQKVPGRKLNDAVCDIIDAGGYSVAVLLDMLPELPVSLQQKVVEKIEDFFYFHPENGVKLFRRLKKALARSDRSCHARLLAAMADISEKVDDQDFSISDLGDQAMTILESDADLGRLSKAIEVLVKASESQYSLDYQNNDKIDWRTR